MQQPEHLERVHRLRLLRRSSTVSSRCSISSAPAMSPSSIAFVSWYDGHRARLRRGTARRRRRRGVAPAPYAAREHVDERGDPTGVLAEVRGDELGRVGPQRARSRRRARSASTSPVFSLSGARSSASTSLSCLRRAPAAIVPPPATNTSTRRVERVVEVARRCRSTSAAVERARRRARRRRGARS